MKTIIQDTCNIIAKRLSDNKIAFSAQAQLSNISQSVAEEIIKGGIGSKIIAINKNSKSIEIEVRNALWDTDFIETALGLIINNEINTIFKKEENLFCFGKTFDDTVLIDDSREIDTNYLFSEEDDVGSLISYLIGVPYTNKLLIQDTPKTGGIIKVIAPDGTQYEGEYINDYIAINEDIDNGYYTAIYEYEVIGNVINMDIKKFPEAYLLELSTIEYSIEQNTIINDLYFIFNKVLPSGNIDLSFENGKAVTPSTKFNALTMPGSNELGRIIEVSRV